jgi:hypothetical protein
MKSLFTCVLVVGSSCLFGCTRETTVKTTETVEGPGGKTTVTTERTVESTGDNPPVSSQGERVPNKDGVLR